MKLILGSEKRAIELKYNISIQSFTPNYNIQQGDLTPILCQDEPHKLILSRWGFQTKKRTIPFARTEGERNKSNESSFVGYGIKESKLFMQPIRQSRCAVIVDAFYVFQQKTAHVVHLQQKERPFSLAGIYTEFQDKENNKVIHSFALITVPANNLLRFIGQSRMPVIIKSGREIKWLGQKTSLAEVTSMLHQYPANLMNAYPVEIAVKKSEINSKALLQPIGQKILPEPEKPLNQKKDWNRIEYPSERNWSKKGRG